MPSPPRERGAIARVLLLAAALFLLAASAAAARSSHRRHDPLRSSIVGGACAQKHRMRSPIRASACAHRPRAAAASASPAPPPGRATPESPRAPKPPAPAAPGPSIAEAPPEGPQLDPTASEAGSPSPEGRQLEGETLLQAPEGGEGASEASPAMSTSPFAATAEPLATSVASYGANEHGELCVGWHSVPQGPQAALTPAGAMSQLAVSEGDDYFNVGGHLWACGTNEYGTAGIGVISHATEVPVPVNIPAEVKDVSAHGWQAIAATADGRVWTWGSNAFGQIGNGLSTKGREEKGLAYPMPAPVAGVEHAASVQSGGPDDVVVLANGDVYGWGGNFGGELALPAGERTRPVKVSGVSGRGVVAVVTGGFLSSGGDLYALTAGGTVLAQGRNDLGELGGPGGPVPLPPVKEVAASVESAYAVTTDGSLYGWGADPSGQLGVGTVTEWCDFHTIRCVRHPVKLGLSGVTKVCAGQEYAAAISNGQVYTFGRSIYGSLGGAATQTFTPLPVPALRNVRATGISCGRFHVVVSYDSTQLVPILTRDIGAGNVELEWSSRPVSVPWHVMYRVASPGYSFLPEITLAPSARGYTLSGLTAGTRYEVAVKNAEWGTRLMWITPVR